MELPETVVERLLATWPVARLATLSADGRPRVVPIVFAWHEGALWSPVDAKPKRGGTLARVVSLRRDPRASVLLDHYAADWTRLWWIRLDARGTVLERQAPESDPVFRAAADALLAKYPQYRATPLFRDVPTLIRLALERRTTWCAGPEALESSAMAHASRNLHRRV